jgi:hypothetical protein
MECRFRNLQSPKHLGSDERFKAREQEDVSAQRKRQGFDVAVNPLSGHPWLFGRPRRRFFPRTNKCFSAEAVALVLTARTGLTATPTSGNGNAGKIRERWFETADGSLKLSAPVGGTDVCKHYSCRSFAVRRFLRVSSPIGKKKIVRFGMNGSTRAKNANWSTRSVGFQNLVCGAASSARSEG